MYQYPGSVRSNTFTLHDLFVNVYTCSICTTGSKTSVQPSLRFLFLNILGTTVSFYHLSQPSVIFTLDLLLSGVDHPDFPEVGIRPQ